MARALECPACGARTPLNALPDAPTFRCERCGQVLKVPSGARSTPKPAPNPAPRAAPAAPPSQATRQQAPPRRGSQPPAAASGAAAGAPPPPPRRSGGNAATGAAISSAAAAAAVSATVNPIDSAPGSAAAAPTRSRRERRNGDAAPVDSGTAAAPAAPGAKPARSTEARAKVHWYWRLLAWVVAVPLGLLVTAWPAYHFEWIKKDDLLDVFVGTGTGRYTRLFVLTLAWALVTALLVQLFVEGGRWFARRRRARNAAGGGGGGRPRGPEPQQPQSPMSPPTRRPAAAARR